MSIEAEIITEEEAHALLALLVTVLLRHLLDFNAMPAGDEGGTNRSN